MTMTNAKKIAFWGTPAFTTRFLETLYEEGFVPSLIVTNPDRPAGRGMQLTAPEPKVWGERHGIRVLQPEKITPEVIEELRKEHWDLFVVVAYGAILPEAVITLPRFGTINVHYSLLPKYRGATPVESAILHGDETTGVSIQQMRFKLDSGPIIAEKEIAIAPADTTLSLREKLNDEALKLLPDVITSVFDGTATAREQDESQATVCKKIQKEDGRIDLSDDPVINDRKFRAYTPSPGTFFMAQKDGNAVRVKIKSAHLEDGPDTLSGSGKRFVLDTVIPENGKPTTGAAFEHRLRS